MNMKRKNIQILSVYNVDPRKMSESLKTIKGLCFNEPRVNENNFCEVEIIGATPSQWHSVMKLY